jgi:hypothetical protein
VRGQSHSIDSFLQGSFSTEKFPMWCMFLSQIGRPQWSGAPDTEPDTFHELCVQLGIEARENYLVSQEVDTKEGERVATRPHRTAMSGQACRLSSA